MRLSSSELLSFYKKTLRYKDKHKKYTNDIIFNTQISKNN